MYAIIVVLILIAVLVLAFIMDDRQRKKERAALLAKPVTVESLRAEYELSDGITHSVVYHGNASLWDLGRGCSLCKTKGIEIFNNCFREGRLISLNVNTRVPQSQIKRVTISRFEEEVPVEE